MRARIDIGEVEAKTKIRAKYLRAIENEEWDLLPGPVYVKSFLRTYGDYLGLDSRLLIDEYKRRYERPADHDSHPIAAIIRERERDARGPLVPSWAIIVAVLAVVVVALFVVGKFTGNNKPTPTVPTTSTPTAQHHATHHHTTRPAVTLPTTTPVTTTTPTAATLKLVPTGVRLRLRGRRHRQEADPRSDLQRRPDGPRADREQAADHAGQRFGSDARQRQAVHGEALDGGDLPAGAADRCHDGQDGTDLHMSAAPVRAGILVTGTEVLTGIISDRNGPWLSEQLRELGVDAALITVVGDRPEDLLAALRQMDRMGLALIVTSGGLGPTADDLTAEVVGRFCEREMVLDERMERVIGEILEPMMKRWPGIDPEAIRTSNRKQAVIPEGATVIDPVGTAPGLVVPFGRERIPAGPTVVVLPGPPRELQPMWRTATQTDAFQRAITGATVYRRGIVRLFGIPESEIANTLRAAEQAGLALDDLEITTCLRRGEIEVSTRFEPPAQPAYDALIDFLDAAPRCAAVLA